MNYRTAFVFLLASLTLVAQMVSDGDALFQKQDWAGAARAFQSAVDKDQHDGRSWFRLGSSLYRLGKNAEARNAFEKAVENQFQAPYAMAVVARSYANENNAAKAAEWLNRAGDAGFLGIAFLDTDPAFEKVKSDAAFAKAREKIDLSAHPCKSQVEYRQFDFWLGEWDVQVSGQVTGHSRIEKMLDGCIVQENWMPIGGIEGKSWNYYNSVSHKWEQLWMSAGSLLKLEGTLKDGAMHYEGVTVGPAGKKILEKLTFTPMAANRVHQVWERSTDEGKTWTTAFDGIYLPKRQS
jgi:tetratricopeptide (TPR) repeat protein